MDTNPALGPARPRVSPLDSLPRGTRAEQSYQIAVPGEGNGPSLSASAPAAGVSPDQPRALAVTRTLPWETAKSPSLHGPALVLLR